MIKVLAKDRNDADNLFGMVKDAKNYNSLAFLCGSNKRDLGNRFKNLKAAKGTFNDHNELKKIWKNILIDAIHFLKINDRREKAFLENSRPTNREQARNNVYGIEELYNYYDQFTKFESTLYGTDTYYRDHLVHPIRVWIIGLHILEKFGERFILTGGGKHVEVKEGKSADIARIPSRGSSATSHGQENKDFKLKISTAELGAMWTIIALTHDLGYPLEKVENVNDQLEKMLEQFGKISFSRLRFNFESQHDYLIKFMLNLISSRVERDEETRRKEIARTKEQNDGSGETAEDKIKQWYTRVRTKYLTKFSKSWEMFDHGIVSSLIMIKSLTYFIESDFTTDKRRFLVAEDARQFVIRSEMLQAMAAHTTPKIYHLNPNTLSFLLVLCDELQVWGRPTFGDIRTGSFSGNAVRVEIRDLLVSDNDNSIHCIISYEKKKGEGNNRREDKEKKEENNRQKEFVKRRFKLWHERLRPAVDDKERKIKFKWDVCFGDESESWKFDFDTSRRVNDQITCKQPDGTILALYD